MSHIPVNHHLRPLYRMLAGLCAVYVLVFGVVGVVQTSGNPAFDRSGTWVLGLRTNLAFSLISIAAGAVILVSVVIGRNVDRMVFLVGSVLFLLAGMIMMLVLTSDANVFNFSMATCVVSYVIGTVLGIAGLYGKVGTVGQAAAEEAARHSGH
jgi:thiol:disulfide interchange protein